MSAADQSSDQEPADRVYVRNAGDPEQVRDAGQKERYTRKRQLDDLREVMSTAAGRRFVWRLMRTANPGVKFSADTNWQYFTLGSANVAAWLEADVERACPERYDLMRQEARKRTGD